MYVTPYIFFDNKCDEALAYYKKVLGARVVSRMTYGETPAKDHVPAEMHNKVIHSAVMIGNTAVMMADGGCPDEPAGGKHAGYSLTISVDSADKAKELFAGLADGGKVIMPLDKTFFAEAFGQLNDRYGIAWMVICEKAHPA